MKMPKYDRKSRNRLTNRKLAKKVLTGVGVGAIIINVVARTAHELIGTTTAILENDTEKSHFVQEEMTQERVRTCEDGVINSQILNE